MLKFRRRGQTAIEALFIMAIILTGVALIAPTYIRSSSITTMDVYVRDAASSACDYLNEGVNVSDTLHEPLNPIVKELNYSYGFFALDGVHTSTSGNDVNVTVVITSKLSLSSGQISVVESAIKEYMLRYISSRPNVSRDGEYLYFGGRRFSIQVTVRGGSP
ncbi:hypothetical protein [Thermococcus sp.]